MQRSGPRVSSACQTCKQRRTKCDGMRPKCSRCRELSRECTYDGVDLRKSRHTHVEFKALNNRVKFLERQVRSLLKSQEALHSNWKVELNTSLIQTARRDPTLPTEALEAAVSTPVSNKDTQLKSAEDVFSRDILDAVNEWIVELPPLLSDKEKTSMVRSLLAKKGSNLQFDQESGKTIYAGPTSNRHVMSTASYPGSELPAMTDTELSLENSALSADELRLFRTFKEKPHNAFMVVCGEFCAEESQLIHQAVSHPLLFYIVLAVAAFFLDEEYLTQRNLSSDSLIEYYSAIFTTSVGKELDNCCLQNVKAFLLRAYLDTLRGRLESATTFNSVACAMAKRLGLHVDCTSDTGVSVLPETRERLTLFWSTLWLDRRIAVLEGRTCQIDHVDISCPRPLQLLRAEEGFLELPLSTELIYACHVEFFWLQDIALNKLYSFSDDVSKDDATSEGHLKYVSWFMSLPPSIKDVSAGKAFDPSFLSFHLSFHSGLILLHRRSISDDEKTAELSNERYQESAASVTSLLKLYGENFSQTLADPMILHAAYTSALAHLILLLQPDVVTYRSSLKSLRTAKQFIVGFVNSSLHAVRILDNLQEFAVKWDISPANSSTFWRYRTKQDGMDDGLHI